MAMPMEGDAGMKTLQATFRAGPNAGTVTIRVSSEDPDVFLTTTLEIVP